MSSSSLTNSPNLNSFESSDNLQRFSHLPFSTSNLLSNNIPTPHVSDTNNYNSAFLQIHIPEDLSFFQQINTGITPLSTSDQEPFHSDQSQSFSSLPDLVPLDQEFTHSTPDLFSITPSIDFTSINNILDTSSNNFSVDPPSYTPSDENIPGYQPPWNREIILRRIRILQTEATDLYRQVDQRRNENIAIYNAAVNTQLRDHDHRYQSNINHLEDLLDLWL